MKMIMNGGYRQRILLARGLFNKLLAIAFLTFRFIIVSQPAFPIANLPGILKDQETCKQQHGGYASQLRCFGNVCRRIDIVFKYSADKKDSVGGKRVATPFNLCAKLLKKQPFAEL
jgi:hypothetical protein